jgi:hypothetical protein
MAVSAGVSYSIDDVVDSGRNETGISVFIAHVLGEKIVHIRHHSGHLHEHVIC